MGYTQCHHIHEDVFTLTLCLYCTHHYLTRYYTWSSKSSYKKKNNKTTKPRLILCVQTHFHYIELLPPIHQLHHNSNYGYYISLVIQEIKSYNRRDIQDIMRYSIHSYIVPWSHLSFILLCCTHTSSPILTVLVTSCLQSLVLRDGVIFICIHLPLGHWSTILFWFRC